MKVLIRKASIGDLETVQQLNKLLFKSDNPHDGGFLNEQWPLEHEGRDYFKGKVLGETGVCFIAGIEGKTVGYLVAKLDVAEQTYRPVKRTELENMLVLKEYRSKGIGKKLVSAFLKWSKEQGAKRTFVKAYSPNERAINFYEKLGFKPHVLELEGDINQDFGDDREVG